MKTYLTLRRVAIFLFTFLLLLNSCTHDSFTTVPIINVDTLSGARIGSDHTVYNHEQYGKFIYTYAKYYLGTIDVYSLLPQNLQADFKKQYDDNIKRTEGWTHNQIIDELVSEKTYSFQQGEIIKKDHNQLLEFINNQPTSAAIMDWFEGKETDVIENRNLSGNEKEELLIHKALVKYALKLKIEQYDTDNTIASVEHGSSTRVTNDCSFWSTLACWIGSLSGGGGLGANAGSTVGLAAGLGGDALVGAGIVGGIVGATIGAIQASQTCQCNNVNHNVCQAPLTISFPYSCYTYGNSLLCEAFAFGDTKPIEFSFNFVYNNNTVNSLYGNFTANDYLYVPGSVLNSSVLSLAGQVQVWCPASPGQPLTSPWYGWYYLSDLGKPFFTFTGTNNLTVSQASYSFINYQIVGPVNSTNATILWELIPSGYPNYSATGTILSGNNSQYITVRWDAHAGFANLKCTTTTQCATVIQYYTIHIM